MSPPCSLWALSLCRLQVAFAQALPPKTTPPQLRDCCRTTSANILSSTLEGIKLFPSPLYVAENDSPAVLPYPNKGTARYERRWANPTYLRAKAKLSHLWLIHWPLGARVIAEDPPGSCVPTQVVWLIYPEHKKQPSLCWVAHTAHHILPPGSPPSLIVLSRDTAAALSLCPTETAAVCAPAPPAPLTSTSARMAARCWLHHRDHMCTPHALQPCIGWVLADTGSLLPPVPWGVPWTLAHAGCAPACFTLLVSPQLINQPPVKKNI